MAEKVAGLHVGLGCFDDLSLSYLQMFGPFARPCATAERSLVIARRNTAAFCKSAAQPRDGREQHVHAFVQLNHRDALPRTVCGEHRSRADHHDLRTHLRQPRSFRPKRDVPNLSVGSPKDCLYHGAVGAAFEALFYSQDLNTGGKPIIFRREIRDDIAHAIEDERWLLTRNWPPFEQHRTLRRNNVFRCSTMDLSNIQRRAWRRKRFIWVSGQLLRESLQSLQQPCGSEDGRAARLREGAVCRLAEDLDFCKTIPFAGARWDKRSRFADDGVSCPDCFLLEKKARTAASDLFV